MKKQFYRSSLLLGEEGIKKLIESKVIIFGLGGVGSICAEALVRAGIGEITIVDNDVIDITNLNRQIQTNQKNIGMSKSEEMAKRLIEINSDLKVVIKEKFYTKDNRDEFFPGPGYDYIIDAIDTISSKIDLASYGFFYDVPVISSMGAGNKLDPTTFEVSDIYKTSVDPIARVMRRELRKLRVEKLKVVFSKEEPIKIKADGDIKIIGSVPFGPAVAGLIMAGEVVKDLIFKSLDI